MEFLKKISLLAMLTISTVTLPLFDNWGRGYDEENPPRKHLLDVRGRDRDWNRRYGYNRDGRYYYENRPGVVRRTIDDVENII